MTRPRVRTVELQLLRHGPAHNQLMSPLTDYFALCGDHPNTTLNFPFEHEALTVRLNALRYKDSEETRIAQVHETAQMLGEVLSTVPGLISELGRYREVDEQYVHLSIATNAAELTLVPFELANSPPGFPGAGGSLCLETDLPVCLTRRSRNVRFDRLKWDTYPRILIVASDAGGRVPLDQHYALLRKLVDPWVRKTPNDPAFNLHDRLVVLAKANVQSIERTVTEAIRIQAPFTHVHILAHGCSLANRASSWGIALHHPSGRGIDAVDGNRLGLLLGKRLCNESQAQGQHEQVNPNVVVLAVCDSANQGTNVSVPGASIAFELHEAGIPLVVGTQFPLTFKGSVVLAESLLRRLLHGCDPRKSLWEARRELFAQNAEKLKPARGLGRHDWCSMVAFAAFPQDIEARSKELERQQQIRRMETQLWSTDNMVRSVRESGDLNQIGRVIEELRSALREFDEFVDSQHSGDLVLLLGISGSANKRVAELVYHGQTAMDADLHDDLWLTPIRRSLKRYLAVALNNRNASWAFVQSLFLRRFLTFFDKATDPDPKKTDADLYQEWFESKYICFSDENRAALDENQLAWHLSDMIELALLLRLIDELLCEDRKSRIFEQIWLDFSDERTMERLRALDHLAQEKKSNFSVHAGRRQLLRYRAFADMLYEPGQPTYWTDISRGKKSRNFAQGGYNSLANDYGEFDSLYVRIEKHILQSLRTEV